MQNFIGKFTVLKGAARELWLTFAIKILNYAAYKVTNLTLVLWLASDLGYGDQKALGLVAAWSLSMTVCTLLVGSLTDVIGLRKTFFLGVWICLIARCVMVLADNKWMALCCGLFPLAVGEALGTPVLVAAVRKYSTTRQRSMAFSVSYMILNVGSFAAGKSFDWLRTHLGEYGHFSLPLLGGQISTYRTLFLVSLGIELLMLPVVWCIRSGAEVTDEGVVFAPEKPKTAGQNILGAIKTSLLETVRLWKNLTGQQVFYRLVAFLLLIAFLKLLFMQMDYVFPKFGIRELGPGAPVGSLAALNSLLAIFLVPIFGALTQKYSAYRMVTLGAVISAASVFIMALPLPWFQTMADGFFGHWVGHYYLGLTGAVHPYYMMITLYVIVLSVGEAFYSPRVYEYASAIAPKGQEASYGALSYIPFLLAKLLIGTVSAALLVKYCPENGERHSQTMWLFIAIIASVAPVGLIALRKLIRVHEAGRES